MRADLASRARRRRRRRRVRQLRALLILAALVATGVVTDHLALSHGKAGRVASRSADVRLMHATGPKSTPAPGRKSRPAPGRKSRPAPGEKSTAAKTTGATTTTPPPARHLGTAAVSGSVDPDGATGLLASATVRAYLAGCSGDITAAVYDVATGTTSLWRPGVLEYTASIVKVDILAALLRQQQQAGQPLSTAQSTLAAAMVEQSDDYAATQLWDEIGQQEGLARFDSQLGLDDTIPGPDGHWGGTRTTAADQVELLRAIVLPNAVLDPTSQSYELGLMESVEPNEAWGVSAGVPQGVTLALKDGWLPLENDGDWQMNSIGWVDGDGRDYILAVLTKNNSTEADGIATVEGLSELVWDALAP